MSIKEKLRAFLVKNRKKLLVFGPIVLVVIFAGIVALVRYSAGEPIVPTIKKASQEEKEPTLVPHALNGVLVSRDVASRRPVAAMIENSQAARPQVGLTSADVVYEAVTEGGITRFMAWYSQVYPAKAGPIRSARSYYVDWLKEIDPIYVHAGGSPTALGRIIDYGIKDYPHANDGTYRREPQAGVASEHTLFANIAQIYSNSIDKRGWEANADIKPWLFKDPSSKPEAAGPLTINFSSAPFKVVWTFDPAKNLYYREMAGSPHKDRLSGEQITAKTIIVMDVDNHPNGTYNTGKEAEWSMDTIGAGNALIYQDGTEIVARWKKPSPSERTRFYDVADNEIKLNRGQIWVEVVPPAGSHFFVPAANVASE